MKTRFMAERRFFDLLRSDCSTEARQEYELAIATVLERYNTTIYENRFIAGGAAEVFTWALLRSVGIDCTLYSDQTKSGDILLPNDRKLSIKSSFQGLADVRLINQMGAGDRQWTTATLFVVSGVGIVFGAPNMVDAARDLKANGEAKILKRAALRALSADPANVFSIEIAHKPPTEKAGFSDKASSLVARAILQEMGSDVLSRAFGDSIARSA